MINRNSLIFGVDFSEAGETGGSRGVQEGTTSNLEKLQTPNWRVALRDAQYCKYLNDYISGLDFFS